MLTNRDNSANIISLSLDAVAKAKNFKIMGRQH
jgi:hypothetical protein